mgnify:CR=1 FL=1
MSIIKTEAIILHSRKEGETIKILTVYSLQFGKMSLMAKGARNAKSRYLGVLDTFNHISAVIYHKENRDIQYISQAEIISSFPSVHGSLGKMALAAIACELLERNEPQEHSNPELFRTILEVLSTLEKAESGLRNIIRAFQLKFIQISGVHPILDHCHACKKTETGSFVFFDLQHGFYTCEKCGLANEGYFRIENSTIDNMRWLAQVPISQSPRAKISPFIGKQMDEFIQRFMTYHFEHIHHLKSIKYLQELSNGLQSKKMNRKAEYGETK